jgi:hypothetical protein
MTTKAGAESRAARRAGGAVVSPAVEMAQELRRGLLYGDGIRSEVHHAYGTAIVLIPSVCLIVWCEWSARHGWRYRWDTGMTRSSRYQEYTCCPGAVPDTALRRVVERYDQLCQVAGASRRESAVGDAASHAAVFYGGG